MSLLIRLLLVVFMAPICVLADEPSSGPISVQLKREAEGWNLYRGGKRYYVQGAGGMSSLQMLSRCGGNSNRLWAVGDETQARLDEAHRNGISVALGLWIEHESEGFDYQDYHQVAEQIDGVLKAVEKYKDHPAVLLWGVGNEMEGYASGDNPAIWSHIEFLCQKIKEIDPHHPTMSVIAEIGGNRIEAIHKLCPSLDIIGINAYGGAASLPDRYRKSGGSKPYIVTEFGPAGPWEVARNNLDAVLEPPSSQKANQYRATYQSIKSDREFCLGSYAFLWGNKQEATLTWFGMLLPDGRKTNVVDVMTELWTGKPADNLCPIIDSFELISSNEVEPGEILEFRLAARDPEGAPFQVEWLVLPEADAYVTGGQTQATPKSVPGAIVASDQQTAKVRAPKRSGIYRVYAFVDDGKRAAAVANVPFRVNRQPLEAGAGAASTLPLVVFDEKETESPYIPSGFMGEVDAIEIDPDYASNVKFGETCMRCQFKQLNGFGGVVWQSPANDWGDQPGGLDLTGAKRMTVWVRGKSGGEKINIGFGFLGDDKMYFDTTRREKSILLTRHWKKFKIDFAKSDLRRIKSGFYWSVAADGKPVEFLLDRIIIE